MKRAAGFLVLVALLAGAVCVGLASETKEPQRPEEDAMHGYVESLRPLLFPAARCG